MSNDEIVEFKDMDDIEGEIELTPPEVYAANLIEWAVDRHASDLFVSDNEKSVVVSVRRLGRVEIVRRLARNYGHRLQGHLRVIGGADAGESMRPVEGRGVLSIPNGGSVDLRLSAIPTLYGQDVAVRLFDPIRGARALSHLGLNEFELSKIKTLLERASGLILIAGPVASGKSSTLYAAIDYLNDSTRKIHTLEDPIEHAIAGVMQSQVNVRAGLDFAELLAAVLRHSPDVIMVGEIRDARTAHTAVRAGASGQLVLASIHAKSSADAIDSMLQYGTNAKFLSGALIGVVSQRLIRKLCPDCRKEVELHEPLHVSDGVGRILGDHQPRMFTQGGCEVCFGDGFTTLTCLPEIMPLGQRLCDAVAAGAATVELESIAIDEGMVTLGEAAAARVYLGDTTAEEVNRVVTDHHLAHLSALSHTATD